jgi:hypothetical protein
LTNHRIAVSDSGCYIRTVVDIDYPTRGVDYMDPAVRTDRVDNRMARAAPMQTADPNPAAVCYMAAQAAADKAVCIRREEGVAAAASVE